MRLSKRAEEEKSKNHLRFTDRYEYYWFDGKDEVQVYRAPLSNPIGVDGYRQGGRWVAPKRMYDTDPDQY